MNRPLKKSLLWGLWTLMLSSIILLSLFAADTVFEERIRRLAWIWGTPHSWGTFFSDDGNPGRIGFWETPNETGSTGAHIIWQTLTGSFWMQTIGWTSLENVTLSNNDGFQWDVNGYGWSDQAGWIDFSGVKFVNSNTSFTGYAWNDGIGWINMLGATLESVSQSLIGKVKVIGNIGGASIFSTTYEISATISDIKMNKIINEIRKNISLLTRNVSSTQLNVSRDSYGIFNTNTVLQGKMIYRNTTNQISRVNYADIKSTFESVANPVQSLIIVWGDLYINDAVETTSFDGKPRAIIVVKNNLWIGGNIYIAWGVTRIKSSLIAEWSLLSARFPTSTTSAYILYNLNTNSQLTLPDRQLYIVWSVISNNTIGGSYGPSFSCPYTEPSPCDKDSSVKYDLNFFRDFQKDDTNVALLRWYPDNRYDDYSVIIEYDPRILSNPPPGIATIK